MSKAYDSRFEFNCNSINDFLSSTKDFQYLILYSTEAKRLEKEFQGKGVSYCATCDGNFFKNQTVCIIGGGNTALDEALYLSRICSKVHLIHRRDEFRASGVTVEQVKKTKNIKFWEKTS